VTGTAGGFVDQDETIHEVIRRNARLR
jgi:hypothetical protein